MKKKKSILPKLSPQIFNLSINLSLLLSLSLLISGISPIQADLPANSASNSQNNQCPPKIVSTQKNIQNNHNNQNILSSKLSTDWDKECGKPENFYINRTEMLAKLKQAKVIYLGEIHDNKEHHRKQLEIIQELYKINPKIAIGMEMFQVPYQDYLMQYTEGTITEAQLVEKTEYKQRWGFNWELYAPILKFTQQQKLTVLALNTPSEVTMKVARQGLSKLTPSDTKYIPPIKEIRTDNVQYRQMISEVFQAHQSGGHGNSKNFENFFQAQVLWDETMADNIVNFLKVNPDYQVIVLAGEKHIIYDYGIPSRVKRRIQDNLPNLPFTQYSVLLRFPENIWESKNQGISDFVLK
ncbi:MAG: ChaN family lipoprotein [Cyanobacteria bacterium P01_A01_bin.45]